jgi:hypothetical protein
MQQFSDDALMDCVTKATRVPAARFENYCQAVERILHESLTPYAAGEGERDTNSSWWRLASGATTGETGICETLCKFSTSFATAGILYSGQSQAEVNPTFLGSRVGARHSGGAVRRMSSRLEDSGIQIIYLIAADRELAFGQKNGSSYHLQRKHRCAPRMPNDARIERMWKIDLSSAISGRYLASFPAFQGRTVRHSGGI